ncbi:TPA: SpoV family signaling peptide [Streptococcus pyogenes]
MKNKLFLVALATVTVLGPSLANPHHGTVHTTEYCTYASDNPHVGLCHEKEDGIQKEEKTFKTATNSTPSLFYMALDNNNNLVYFINGNELKQTHL